MLKRLDINKINKQFILLASSLVGLFLLIAALVLSSGVSRLKKDEQKNLATLNEVLPGFNKQALEQLKQEVNQLETQLLALVYLFDPEQEIKKGYDPAIYFVEELGKINQFLKLKAANKQINYSDLGFKETLPEEKEARYLLRQLYTLKEVVSRGMDSGVDFNAITPQPAEDLDILNGAKVAKTRIELTAQAPALIEFLIQVSEIMPLCSIESLLLKSEGSAFKVDMTFSQMVIEAAWKDKGIPFKPLNEKALFSEQEKFVNILRGNNPFPMVKPQGYTELPYLAAKALPEQPKQLPRFLYRGKAILRAKEVAVIEDTLSQETVFLALGEKIGDFILEELKDFQIILKNINTNQKIIIKREEK